MRSHNTSKKDANHNALVEALLAYHGGQWLEYYNVGIPGHPDGLHVAPGITVVGKFNPAHAALLLRDLPGVVRIFDGAKVHIEFKNLDAGGALTAQQVAWMERYPPVVEVAGIDDIIKYGRKPE